MCVPLEDFWKLSDAKSRNPIGIDQETKELKIYEKKGVFGKYRVRKGSCVTKDAVKMTSRNARVAMAESLRFYGGSIGETEGERLESQHRMEKLLTQKKVFKVMIRFGREVSEFSKWFWNHPRDLEALCRREFQNVFVENDGPGMDFLEKEILDNQDRMIILNGKIESEIQKTIRELNRVVTHEERIEIAEKVTRLVIADVFNQKKAREFANGNEFDTLFSSVCQEKGFGNGKSFNTTRLRHWLGISLAYELKDGRLFSLAGARKSAMEHIIRYIAVKNEGIAYIEGQDYPVDEKEKRKTAWLSSSLYQNINSLK